MKKKQIEKELSEVGACWAVKDEKYVAPGDPGNPWEVKPTWHIHPDCSDPREDRILCFNTLSEIHEWIKFTKEGKS